MGDAHSSFGTGGGLDPGYEPGQAISLDEASEIAEEVRDLIDAGNEHSAWELIRHLHPADIGAIVAGLPRASRDTMVRVMSPETVAWILRQMNPVEAARLGARLGSGMLSFVLGGIHPHQALATLRRLSVLRGREVHESLEQPVADAGLLAHGPDTAGALMVAQFPTVDVDGLVESARDSLRAQGGERQKFTHVFAVDANGELVGHVTMVDLALAANETPIRSVVTPVVATVAGDTPAAECARLQRHYNLTQLPVVENGRLAGVILAESLLSAAVEQDTRQMQRVA